MLELLVLPIREVNQIEYANPNPPKIQLVAQ